MIIAAAAHYFSRIPRSSAPACHSEIRAGINLPVPAGTILTTIHGQPTKFVVPPEQLFKMPGKNLIPFQVLQTERLTLRQLLSSDDTEILSLRSNDNVNKYLGRKPARSLDDAKNFIRTIQVNTRQNTSIYWAITMNGADKLMGTICLFDFSDDNAKAEIGFELLPGYQGKGIMQEAASKVIAFAFQHLGLHSIDACTHFENLSSVRLLEKLNFERQGVVDNLLLFRCLLRKLKS